MTARFKCLEENCRFDVEYVPQKLPVGLGNMRMQRSVDKPRKVYLTCAAGHVHAYLVTPPRPETKHE